MSNYNMNLSEEDALKLVLMMSLQQNQNVVIDPASKGSIGMKSKLKREHKTSNGQVLQIRKGDITTEQVDVIVNAANNRLDHIDGVAGAIVRAGGQKIQDESDKYVEEHGKLQDGEIFVSSPGKLSCKNIFHAVGPIWRKGREKESTASLIKVMENCLNEAEKKKYKSISLPAISTGVFDFPKDLCADLLIGATLEFFKKNPKSSVTEVRLTNFDDKTVKIFEKQFDKKFSKDDKKNDDEKDKKEEKEDKKEEKKEDKKEDVDYLKLINEHNKKDDQKKDDSNSLKLNSTLVKEYKGKDQRVIQVRKGDLTKESTDAIVNAANCRLIHQNGLAGAIVRAGGKKIQDECDNYTNMNGSLSDGEVIVTTAGNLPCKKVIHAVGPQWEDGQSGEKKSLAEAVKNSLDEASKLNLKSITFPAISTGSFGFPKELCAQIMFDVTLKYFNDNPKTSLNLVCFTNFDDPTVYVFENELDVRFNGKKEESKKNVQKNVQNIDQFLKFNQQGLTDEQMLFLAMQLSQQQHQLNKPTQGSVGMQSVLKVEYKTKSGQVIQVRKGDLTKEQVDVLVNAANSRLIHENGLAGAIVKNGGKSIQDECLKHVGQNGDLDDGEVFVSGAGNLPCKKIVHAVGPIYHDGNQGEKNSLVKAVVNSLKAADKLGLKSIAFPAISTGVFGYPKGECAKVLFDTALEFFNKNSSSTVKEIRFTNFDDPTVDVFVKEFKSRNFN